MDYPYRQYLKFLLTKKESQTSIMENCLRLKLVMPRIEILKEIQAEIGRFPSSWEPQFRKKNEYFCKWLRKQGVIAYWRRDDDYIDATNFLYRTNLRHDFETLSISHTSIEKVRSILLLKYEKHLVPELDVLESYYKYYWDLSKCTQQGLVNFLTEYHNSKANLAALQGNLTLSYSQAQIPQVVSDEAFLDNFISLVSQQVNTARKSFPDSLMPHNMMVGLATLTRQAQDALLARREIKEAGRVEVLDTIRQQALSFQMRIEEQDAIPTFDEIIELELEEESEEEHSNVHKLTVATK